MHVPLPDSGKSFFQIVIKTAISLLLNKISTFFMEQIADLENLESNPEVFEEEVALWICNSMFAKAAKKMDTKRVFLMTNNDNPNGDRVELQRSAITRANDNIIKMSDEEANFSLSDSGGKLDELMKQVRQKEFKKRTAFRVPFIIGEGLEIGVAGYNLVTEVKPSSYTYLLGATNEEVKVVTSYFCSVGYFTFVKNANALYQTTSQQLGTTDMDSYYNYGGKKAVFSKDEVAKMKNFGAAAFGYHLEKPYYNLKHSAFLFPDEKIEEFDENCNQLRPSGFHMLHLPFSDDIRKPPAPEFDVEKRVPVLEEAVAALADIIDKVTIKGFSLYDYENPTLQKHYANLQAIALDRDCPNDVKDRTVPDNVAINKRISKLVEKFKAVLPEDEVVEAPPTKRKAPASSQASSGAAKKVKPEADSSIVKEHWTSGTLKKLTVPVLQQFLTSVGVKPVKKKDELMDQVDQFFAKSG
ncbi:SPOC like C-terminal domain-containing protein [Chytridium lagenaria]|nr:SPOC like C-terminal domain-containing protein [Chytridium lagenaria]